MTDKQTDKQVVLSGMRPTGKLHVGHLEGVLREWVDLQKEHDCNFFVADYHAITTNTNTKDLKQDTFDMVKDWIAFGVDPEKAKIFIQSMVPEHTDLHTIFSMLVNLGRLERLPTFNDYMREIIKVDDKDVKQFNEAKRAKVNYGFLGYPVLQTADILIYKTNIVPIGEDQLPHLELTRELAKRFNHLYGETFPVPEAKLGHKPRILGTDGRKMSKSYNNVISPMDDLDTLFAKVRSMVTDTQRGSLKNPGNPYNCSVFDLHEVYDKVGSENISSKCRSANLGCGDCKKMLPEKIFEAYKTFREKRVDITDSYVAEVLKSGCERARVIASATMKLVKHQMLMDYLGGK
ncbi:MAG: tryptophan--tRNA ligase [Nanoarchaeota archaeon]|nr:tryptophan--tRNA ligase [Nanoarchaeota archaeon]